MADANDLAKMVPGFDFLQGLMKNAGVGLPSMGQWVAPTFDPQELGKRIEELRTVQFWLEQNAKLLGTTIQALEVQRMTLSTLQTMNLPLADLRESLKIATPAKAPGSSAAPAGVDPMQWWGALTQQFTELAGKALRDSSAEAARAGAMIKQGVQSAAATLEQSAAVPAKAAKSVAQASAGRRRRG